MSHFSVVSATKKTVELSDGNTLHAQQIRIFLCHFLNFPIIYLVGPVYYISGHPYNIISLGYLKFCVGFQKVKSEPLEHCNYVDPKGNSWRSPY